MRTRGKKRKHRSGPRTRHMAYIFDSYSSGCGEMILPEIYKYSKQISSQKTSQTIFFMYSDVWHESAEICEISEDTVDVF